MNAVDLARRLTAQQPKALIRIVLWWDCLLMHWDTYQRRAFDLQAQITNDERRLSAGHQTAHLHLTLEERRRALAVWQGLAAAKVAGDFVAAVAAMERAADDGVWRALFCSLPPIDEMDVRWWARWGKHWIDFLS